MAGSPRMRRMRADYELMQELVARSDLITFKAMDARPGVPPERYIVTFDCKSIVSVDRAGNPKYGNIIRWRFIFIINIHNAGRV